MTAVLIPFGNSAASIPESDKRCRVNGLRESFGVIGAPIRLSMRAGGESLRSQETEGVRDFGAIRAFSRRPLAKAPPGGTGLQPDRDLVYSALKRIAPGGDAMSDGQWQLQGTAAELFERYLVPAITAKWAEDLLDRAQPRGGEAILDIACGTGIVARLAAKRMGRGLVTGLDLNAGMLNVARSAPTEGAAIIWIEGSALVLPFPEESFDLVVCQQGFQFFPDQRKALSEVCRVLKGGGRAALSVYSRIERTPGANAFALALDDVVGRDASRIKRGEHSFTDATQLETLFRDSGFNTIAVQTVEQTIEFPSVLDYVRFQLLATPMTVLLRDQTEPERAAIISSIAARTIALSTPAMLEGGRFTFPQEAYVAIAQRYP
jgi:ubiquinone/menaquinone biosynthesis C-methylase UbiE